MPLGKFLLIPSMLRASGTTYTKPAPGPVDKI